MADSANSVASARADAQSARRTAPRRQPDTTGRPGRGAADRRQGRAGGRSWAMIIWVAVALGVGVTAVVLGWGSHGGVANPAAAGAHMSRTTAVLNSAILVFREGLETILV